MGSIQLQAEVFRTQGGVAAAALAQLGRFQDCTSLVSNALAAQGIYHHGWPASYFSLGTVTSDPQPGDLIYYANGGTGLAHIAVYIGNGQAVHGGWQGNQTVIASAYVGSGPVFIRLDKPKENASVLFFIYLSIFFIRYNRIFNNK